MTERETDVALKYLDLAWANIRHNESLRNVFFGLYLSIASIFLIITEKGPKDLVTPEVLVIVGVFIWFMGVLFLWTYVRLKGMIERDADVTASLNELLLAHSQALDPIRERHAEFRRVFNQKRLRRFGTVSSCVIFGTLTIAALVATASVWMLLGGSYLYFLGWFFLFLAANFVLLRAVARKWGQ